MQPLKNKDGVSPSNLSYTHASEVNNYTEIWGAILNGSSAAWYRHTLNLQNFHKAVAQEKHVVDASYFITNDNTPIGIQPLLIMDAPGNMRSASYNGGPLPWPCFLDDDYEQWKTYQDFSFQTLLNICHTHKVDRLDIALNAPQLSQKESQELFYPPLKSYNFLDSSFHSHLVEVHEKSYGNMRSSYRRNIRKFLKEFSATSYCGNSVNKEIEQAYFDLHVKDAGGQFRTRKSYTKMADIARNNEACFIVARKNDTSEIVGILILATYKEAAYDSSVAINPAYQQSYISHILKAEALKYLHEKGMLHYELGAIALPPSIKGIPSHKNQQISFFKDGFARGKTKQVFAAEKHFTQKSITHRVKTLENDLIKFYNLTE